MKLLGEDDGDLASVLLREGATSNRLPQSG